MEAHIRFQIGQPVHHKLFGYRGVVADSDPEFNQSEAWYEAMAHSKPPKDKPWYSILVHDSPCMTYVSERNLEPDLTGKTIEHPYLFQFFNNLENGMYKKRTK